MFSARRVPPLFQRTAIALGESTEESDHGRQSRTASTFGPTEIGLLNPVAS